MPLAFMTMLARRMVEILVSMVRRVGMLEFDWSLGRNLNSGRLLVRFDRAEARSGLGRI
jgi:hypothetical protein